VFLPGGTFIGRLYRSDGRMVAGEPVYTYRADTGSDPLQHHPGEREVARRATIADAVQALLTARAEDTRAEDHCPACTSQCALYPSCKTQAPRVGTTYSEPLSSRLRRSRAQAVADRELNSNQEATARLFDERIEGPEGDHNHDPRRVTERDRSGYFPGMDSPLLREPGRPSLTDLSLASQPLRNALSGAGDVEGAAEALLETQDAYVSRELAEPPATAAYTVRAHLDSREVASFTYSPLQAGEAFDKALAAARRSARGSGKRHDVRHTSEGHTSFCVGVAPDGALIWR
jgi:hypothetical protein